MNLNDAARHLARRFHGGIECLAIRLGKRASTLRHELAGSDAYKLGIEDAELITQFAIEQHLDNPLQILNTFAANCGAMVIPLPDIAQGVGSTFSDLAGAAKEFSEFVAVTATAASDGKVTANELRDVDRELAELIGCAQRVRSGLAAVHEAGKPGSVQAQTAQEWVREFDGATT